MFNSVQDFGPDARGFHYVGLSQSWKRMCLGMPDTQHVNILGSQLLHTAGIYATQHKTFNLDGRHVVIQAWKGDCPKFLLQREMPGGIGGEVGVYHRDADRAMPADLELPASVLADIPRALREPTRVVFNAMIKEGVKLLNGKADHWWPHPLASEIQMSFTNPETNELFFDATPHEPGTSERHPENGYWMSRWMRYEDYHRYKATQRHVPMWAVNYVMKFVVAGHHFIWDDPLSDIRQLD